MITCTLAQLKTGEAALAKLFSQDLPIAISFAMRKLVAAVNAELAHYEQERQKLVLKYGVDDGKGNTTVEQSKLDAFMSELAKLLEVVVKIASEGIEITKLFDSDIKMTPVEMANIEPFIKE